MGAQCIRLSRWTERLGTRKGKMTCNGRRQTLDARVSCIGLSRMIKGQCDGTRIIGGRAFWCDRAEEAAKLKVLLNRHRRHQCFVASELQVCGRWV